MQEPTLLNFRNIVKQLYLKNISNLSSNLDFIVQSKQLNKQPITKETLMANLVSLSFFSSLNEAIDKIYLNTLNKNDINVVFNFSNYIDYLINDLENKNENGPFLAAAFIKKINSIHHFPKTIEIHYSLSFHADNYIVGYSTILQNECIIDVKRAYSETIKLSLNNDIKQEIRSLVTTITDEEVTLLALQITEEILFHKTHSMKNGVYYNYTDFFSLLNYSAYIFIDDKKLTKKSGISYLKQIILDSSTSIQTSYNFEEHY